jgi:nucleoredoxin
MEEIIGNKLTNNKLEEVNISDAMHAKIIALLFTATWCSPCVIFEKELVDIYNEANIGEKNLEIIQISYDKSEDIFKKSITNKPWLFIPFNDNKIKELTDKFGVLSIPMFFVMNKDGKIITDTGRKELLNEGVKIIDKWLEITNK